MSILVFEKNTYFFYILTHKVMKNNILSKIKILLGRRKYNNYVQMLVHKEASFLFFRKKIIRVWKLSSSFFRMKLFYRKSYFSLVRFLFVLDFFTGQLFFPRKVNTYKLSYKWSPFFSIGHRPVRTIGTIPARSVLACAPSQKPPPPPPIPNTNSQH